MNKPYHNKGFGMAFFIVFLLLVPLPILGLWAVDGQDWVDRFTTKYFSPWQSEFWEQPSMKESVNQITTVNSGGTFAMKKNDDEGVALLLTILMLITITLGLNALVWSIF